MTDPSLEAHPLITWVSPEHFGHRGLFACVSSDGVEVLRFYPDGRVARARGGALTLRVHSRKTGARYEDHYTLHDVTGCDTTAR